MNVPAETQQRAVSPVVSGRPVAALIPHTIEEAYRLATAVSKAGMAPSGMDTPEQCLIAILAGAEVGLAPMQAIQSIAVINKRPCMWGDALIGVVRASPACQYVREWIDGEGDGMVAYCETLRKGEQAPVVRSFSVAQAKKADLWRTTPTVTKSGRNGSYEADSGPWFKYPERMLQMRARAYCLRDVYADVLRGLSVREEVEDYEYQGPDNAKDVTPRAASPMAERYQPKSNTPAEEPTPQEEVRSADAGQTSQAPTEERPGNDGLTEADLSALRTWFGKLAEIIAAGDPGTEAVTMVTGVHAALRDTDLAGLSEAGAASAKAVWTDLIAAAKGSVSLETVRSRHAFLDSAQEGNVA